MKTELNIEESARLIELGVDKRYAELKITHYEDKPTEIKRVFTLTDILSILPKMIDGHHLNIDMITEGYTAGYIMWDDDEKWEAVISNFMPDGFFAPELIDALNSLLIWTITNGHLKTEKK